MSNGYGHQEAADAARSAMVSVIGLDSEKVQLLCDAANEEVDEENKVQIANYLCTVRFLLLESCGCISCLCSTFFSKVQNEVAWLLSSMEVNNAWIWSSESD